MTQICETSKLTAEVASLKFVGGVAAAAASRPLLLFFALILTELFSAQEYRVIDVEHYLNPFIYFDVQKCGRQLIVLLYELLSLRVVRPAHKAISLCQSYDSLKLTLVKQIGNALAARLVELGVVCELEKMFVSLNTLHSFRAKE